MTQKRARFGALLPAAFILSLAAAMATPAIAMAASGGDSNRGDVWLDNVGRPAGPGHEMDPHLGCTDINLWGANMGDASGTYIIDGWPPSGHMEQDYPPAGRATWHYSAGKQPQVISVISVRTLIADAVANGDTPSHQGYHFKLQLTQDPQKHKTFWVNCAAPSSVGGGNAGGSTGGTTGGSTGGTTTGSTSGTTTGSTGGATTGSTSGSHQVSGSTTTSSGVGAVQAVNQAAVSNGSAQAAGLAQTGSGVAFPVAALLLGLLILLSGVSFLARPLPMRR